MNARKINKISRVKDSTGKIIERTKLNKIRWNKAKINEIASADQRKMMRMYVTYQKNYYIMKAKVSAITSNDTYIPKEYSLKEYIHQVDKQKEIYKKNSIHSTNYARDIAQRQLSTDLISKSERYKQEHGTPIPTRGRGYVHGFYTKQRQIIREYMAQGMSRAKAKEEYLKHYDFWLTEKDWRYHTDTYYDLIANYYADTLVMPTLGEGSDGP